MPVFTDYKLVTITAAGGTYTMAAQERCGNYAFDGAGTLVASYAIDADLTNANVTGKPHRVKVLYKGIWLLNGNNITVFGTPLTQGQALSGNVLFDCIYDGAAWTVTVSPSTSEEQANYEGVKTRALTSAGLNLTLMPGVANEWQELAGDGSSLAANSVITGALTPGRFFVHLTTGNIPNGMSVTIFGIALTAEQITNGNIFVFAYFDVLANVWRAQLMQAPGSQTWNEVEDIEVSFEAGELCQYGKYIPYNATAYRAFYWVTKLIEASGNAQVQILCNGAATDCLMVIPAGSALETTNAGGAAITVLNTIAAGQVLSVFSSKVVPGGKALITVFLLRRP